MKRILLVVAYDGTNYHGWQFQDNAIAVEQVLTEACKDLFQEEIVLIGASRTDTGVHAMGNVAVFDTDTRIPAEKICYALNQRLPEDIRIQRSFEVPDSFHPRYTKTEKIYEYTIENKKICLPTNRLYSYFVYQQLDIEAMQRAAAYFVGEHDFQSFCAAGSQVKSTVRSIYSMEVEEMGDLVKIRVRGNGFLYNMVRILAGTLIEVGKGRIKPGHMNEIIKSKDRSQAGPTAPAHGLSLIEIKYEELSELPNG